MTIPTYEAVLEQVRHLTAEEQERLREDIARLHTGDAAHVPQSSLVAALEALEPIRTEALDAMEQAIQEDCEVIDRRDW